MKWGFLFKRAKRKCIKICKDLIYYNYSYKPDGIYQTSKSYIETEQSERAVYVEIYSALVSHLSITADLYQATSDYLKPDLQVTTTYLVVALPNGRVHTDNATSVAIISQQNKLIADVSFSYSQGKVVAAEQNNIFRQKHFAKPDKIKGTVFSLLTGGAGINNYFHWLVDVLPRLHLLRESGMFEQVDYFLVPAYGCEFQKQSLKLLGIGEEKIIEGDKHPHILADLLIASSAPRGSSNIIPHWLCNFIRYSFLQPQLLTKPYPPRIYISRKDSRFRHVTNEAALTTLLAKYGFRTYMLSELSFQEQINLFASAQVVIAPHGAGLINLIFCRSKTAVLEIFAGGYIKASYHDLANKNDLIYNYMICENSPKVNTVRKGMKLNIFVEIDKIVEILPRIMAKETTF